MPEPAPKKTFYLIDGHAQFFRAYHAIRSGLTSPVTKEPTNMTFGFVGMLLKVLREYKPDYLAVVIDAAGDRETFRSELYADYKANRTEAPEDLRPQIDRCLRILKDMNVPVLAEPGVEADDVIATIVRRLQREQPDLHIRIVSKDKDLTQLLNHNFPGVELFDVHKDQAVTAADIFGVEGVQPQHVRDILALMGDTVDNVPGVPGVGPKTAGQLILQYGSLDNLLAHLDEIKGKRRENIEAAKHLLPISKQLVSLKEDVPVVFELEQARSDPRRLPLELLTATMRELGFNRYQDELKALTGNGSAAAPPLISPSAARAKPASVDGEGLFSHLEEEVVGPSGGGPTDPGEYECIRTAQQLDDLIAQIKAAGEFAIDTETAGLNPISDGLCGVCISIKPKTGVYIPVRSPEAQSHMDERTVIEQLRPVLEDPAIRKIGHNLKFDINVLRRAGVRLKGPMWDTMIASYVFDSARSSHGMDVLALALLRHTNIPITDLIGSGKKQKCFDTVPLDRATHYAAEDADITLRLRDVMAPQIKAMGLTKLFDELEMPLVEVLAEMEWNGIRVDPDELDRQREHLQVQIALLKKKISDAAPFPFNPDSPRQLAAVLFNKPDQEPPGIAIRSLRRGKTGPSTDVEVLEKLAADPSVTSELPRLIVDYRQLTKLVNTYLVALKDAINPITKRVHCSFNQTVAATGRISASDPNLQNIPIRTDVGREIRRAFVAEPGNVLISADYSQIELRILAHLSDDPALIEAFESGQDIHRAVAAQVHGVKPEDVTPVQRNSAKMVNFGIIYGITAFGLARRLTMGGAPTTDRQAGQIIADYKARFSRIDAFLDQCVRQAQTMGYVETMLGRRRTVPQVHARNPQERALGERVAINSVVQGSAADLIKLAMIDIQRCIDGARTLRPLTPTDCNPWASNDERDAWSQTRMVLQIHDELVFETPRKCADTVQNFVVERMQRAMTLKVPLVVESAYSENWIDAK
jgi:DNA polymerase-1